MDRYDARRLFRLPYPSHRSLLSAISVAWVEKRREIDLSPVYKMHGLGGRRLRSDVAAQPPYRRTLPRHYSEDRTPAGLVKRTTEHISFVMAHLSVESKRLRGPGCPALLRSVQQRQRGIRSYPRPTGREADVDPISRVANNRECGQ
jgi:hypothetical protein